jgi:site-specific DNA-methyltransferase (adenine-specific)
LTKDVWTSYRWQIFLDENQVFSKRRPGEIRDAIVSVLAGSPEGVSLGEIVVGVHRLIGEAPPSSVRSYLRLNTPDLFERTGRGRYSLRPATKLCEPEPSLYAVPGHHRAQPSFSFGLSVLYNCDCFDWLSRQPERSVQAVVTDPPYGLLEYSEAQQQKLRLGRGGVWRIPPSFDGVERSPLPRFTVLTPQDLRVLDQFFCEWGRAILRVLVPGANVVVASNPLVSYIVSGALARAGLERRGELVRLVMTMRGGDRPKAAHEEFTDVSVMPRSMYEPWLLFRKPIENRVQDNLRRWKTGGFRRPSHDKPFGDIIQSAPTNRSERELAPHPSLKPQAFLRALVRGVLPLGEGTVLDPFAGSGSTLAAAESVGYSSIGIEKDEDYFALAEKAIPRLTRYKNGLNYSLSL